MDSAACAPLGCRGDHWPVASARPPVGGSSCGCVWTRIPMSPGACVRAVPPIVPKRVGVRVAGTAPFDGDPETAVTRQWRFSPRHADLDSKLVWAGSQESIHGLLSIYSLKWAPLVKNKDLKTAVTCFIHFSHYSTVMRTINNLYSELKDEIFGTWIFGKFGKEVAWSTEFGWWVYLQACEPGWGSVSKYYRKKQRTPLCAHLPWEPAFGPVHRSAHAWILPLTGALKQHKSFTLREERNSWDFCSLNFEHQILTSLIASNRASKARAMHRHLCTSSSHWTHLGMLGKSTWKASNVH